MVFRWLSLMIMVLATVFIVGCDRDNEENDNGTLTPTSDSNSVKWVEQKGVDTLTVETTTKTTIKGGLWKTIKCGGLEDGDDHLNKLRKGGYQFNRGVKRIFGTIMFQTLKEKKEVKFGKIRISDVFDGPATPAQLYSFVLNSDVFELAPNEAASEIIEAYDDQPEDETVIVVSNKLNMVKSQERWQLGVKGGQAQSIIAIPMSVTLDPSVEWMIVAIREK